MGDQLYPIRSTLALTMLCAWNGVRVDQAPPEWMRHPSDINRQGWERVAEAARRFILAEVTGSPATRLYEALATCRPVLEDLENVGEASTCQINKALESLWAAIGTEEQEREIFSHPDGGRYVVVEYGELKDDATGAWLPSISYRSVGGGKLFTTTRTRWDERFTAEK